MARRTGSNRDDSTPGLFDVPLEETWDNATSEPPAEPPAESSADTREASVASRPPQRPAPAEPGPPAVPPEERAREKQAGAEAQAYTVTGLTEEIAARVGGLGKLRVEGELSGVKRPSSGHVYFDLKDEGARIACVVWRSTVRRIQQQLEDGLQALVHGRLDVYAPHGSYKLIVDRVEPVGLGVLLAKLEALKQELAAQGRLQRSRPLPARPEKIGVVTSRDGAALRDFLRTRSLRWPGYPVRLAHAAVQGALAAPDIAAAIRALDASGVDVIVVCRGGGSLEDLWAFNERVVADAIWATSVPVVSGVGHESDTTLADLVADHRAHTPTDAAQTVIPDRGLLVDELERRAGYLIEAITRACDERRAALSDLARRRVLRRPDWILGDRRRALGLFGARLRDQSQGRIERALRATLGLHHRLKERSPRNELERRVRRMDAMRARLVPQGPARVDAEQHKLAILARALEGVSPLAVLGRGYSITLRAGTDEPLRDASTLRPGDRLQSRLQSGQVTSTVDSIEAGPDAAAQAAQDTERPGA